MKIIEVATQAKKTEDLNEDGFFYSQHFCAVIDGVTSKAKREIWAPTPGSYAKNLIINHLEKVPAKITSYEFYKEINQLLRFQYTDLSFFETYPNERLQVNMIIYSKLHQEIWFFGDCHCLVDGKYISNKKKIDSLLGDLRSFYYQANTDEETKNDPGRQAIQPFLNIQANLANTIGEFGYLVVDGIGNVPEKIKIIKVPEAKEIVLASDGYPFLKSTLQKSEDALKRLKETDPLLIHSYKSTKGFNPEYHSFDDRTYLRFLT